MICKYRVVLSVDGGGIRGIIPLRILEYLQEAFAEIDPDLDITSWVDVFASTSTSTIFTGALMVKDEKGRSLHTPKEILSLYVRRGEQIFAKNNGLDPQNSVYPLNFVLQHFFGDITMEDLRNHFLFVSYNSSGECPFTFTDTMERNRNLTLSKVMTACSAYPGVFPPLRLGNMELVDGMLTTQNPAQLAYDYAKLFYTQDPIILISIGTGTVEGQAKDIFEIESDMVHDGLKARSMSDRNLMYFRFQPKLSHLSSYAFEEGQNDVEQMLEETNHFLAENQHDFDRLIHLMAIRANSW